MSEPVGVAMIGTGRWAGRLAQAIHRSNLLELVTCYSRNPEKRAAFAEKFECGAAPSLDAAIGHPEVEGVLLVTPNNVHAQLTLVCAEAGKHVYSEKPIADTMEDGITMRDACDAVVVTLFVGHCFRRLGAARKTKELIEEGKLGEVVLAEANFSLKSSGLTPESWRYYRETCPGGPLMQLGIHHADTLQYLLGSVESVYGSFARLITEAEIDDVSMAMLEFESGARGVLSSSYVSPKTFYIRLYGTEATLDYTTDMSVWPNADKVDEATALTLVTDAGKEIIPFQPSDMVLEELEEFAQCVRGEAIPETGAPEALAALQVIRGAIESYDRGKPVWLEAI
ncbi:MAG: hypothetical protein A2Z14_13340 [Chloroflexi bacterium RBG_16_48_8]|nr:MAG: hypothetical protein A2Z14_13340 [Chloroflexi bacterium RBG_16_48_8]